MSSLCYFFFNDTATTEIYTLSLHDALPISSTAAFQPGPFMAIYYATKAFVFSFSVALAEELRGTGVSVTTLCPGFTESEFHRRAQMKLGPRAFGMMSAESVSRAGYHGCMKGDAMVIPG